MFYLGFSNCASAELCLLALSVFGYYLYLAKKDDLWRFTKPRPSYDYMSFWGDLTNLDRLIIMETFYDFYLDKYEKSDLYAEWFYEYDASDQMAEHVASVIRKDEHRVELRQFLDREVTERWNLLYKRYRDPKDAWYS